MIGSLARLHARRSLVACTAVGFGLVMATASGRAGQAPVQTPAPRIDYLTFAQGAVPVSVGGTGVDLGAGFGEAIRIIDGNNTPFSLLQRIGTASTDLEFVYALPALTTFDRFAVPEIRETPSPSQTFFKTIEISGSTTGPDGGFVPLAAATLSSHAKRGEETELSMRAMTPVRWVRVRLAGGINMPRPQAFLEFSEIIGNGTQETPALATHFTGVWQGRGVLIGLRQSGAVVSGCYDTSGRMTGTVTGNVLRGQGIDLSDRTPTSFILSVAPDGTLRGVASTNRAPFRLYTGTGAPPNVRASCAEPPPPVLGCGSVIHGITFAFDSSVIRPESEPVLATLFAGLQADKSTAIVIEGHTSNEGSIQYNQQLSERRAAAVVEDLVRRGITRSRVRPAGLGETRPVAGNDDESGRSMNRRVEVHCG